MANASFRCPRCGKPVIFTYFNTAGQHWECPHCGRNSDNYTLIQDKRTGALNELPMEGTGTIQHYEAKGKGMIQQFEFLELPLRGAYLVKPFYVSDDRGGFIKDYNIETFKKNGIEHKLKETFYTISEKGVIRGIHFQEEKQQAKLVRCIQGRVFDVIVDLRPGSETYGKYIGVNLSGENRYELYVPEYFGHGYLVLENSIVSYKCSEVFWAEGDSGIRYDDSDIGIIWPFWELGPYGSYAVKISEKDKSLMSFREYSEKYRKTGEGK